MAVKSQCVEDFLYALGCYLAEFGGVPKVLVPDNLKSAITKANRDEPDINSALEDFANHSFTFFKSKPPRGSTSPEYLTL